MEEKKRTFGWKKSKIDSSISIYDNTDKNDLEVYNRVATMPVIDQGEESSCVSQTIYELYGFYCKNILGKENDITPTYVYYKRHNKGDGMTCRDAFEILQSEGKIGSFAKIESVDSIKHAILSNGGVMLAVKVYDSTINDFWDGSGRLEGGHAITALGFDEKYLYFKNSWGETYGKNGRWKFPLKKINSKLYEAWTITS